MMELLSEALNLVLYGMGSVFVFLTLLVGVTRLMSRLLQLGANAHKTDLTEDSRALDAGILAAMTVVIKHYRSHH